MNHAIAAAYADAMAPKPSWNAPLTEAQCAGVRAAAIKERAALKAAFAKTDATEQALATVKKGHH